jgi:hypothetical protein
MPRGTPYPLTVPTGGVRYDLLPHEVPPGSLADSKNVIVSHGRLIPRPGLTALLTGAFGEQVVGGIYYKTAGGLEKVVAMGLTTVKVANFSTNTWDNITGTALSGSADDQGRFIIWPEGGVKYVLALNNVNGPKEWDGAAATCSALTGLSQWTTAKDWAVLSNRLLVGNTVEGAVRYPYRLRFSDFNTRSTWQAVNLIDLSDTNDDIVAVRALGRTSAAILKEQSQWICVGQTGVFPFRVELQDTQPGPASPNAVIERFGILYYLGQDGSAYSFDGVRTAHIGEPIRKKVQANLNMSTVGRVHGFYRQADRSLYWFYPTTNNNPTEAVSYQLDTQRWFHHALAVGIEATASWPFRLVSSLSWDALPVGWTWDTISTDYPAWDSFLSSATQEELIGSTSQVYRVTDTGNDSGSAIDASWDVWRAYEPGKRARADALETFFKQTSSSVTGTIKIGTTDSLATDPTYPAELQQSFDLSDTSRHLLDTATATTGTGTGTPEAQFIATQHAVSGTIPWEWRGATLYTTQQEVS